MRNLNSIRINSDNVTAHFQGGVYSEEVISTLWEQGFVTGNVYVWSPGKRVSN